MWPAAAGPCGAAQVTGPFISEEGLTRCSRRHSLVRSLLADHTRLFAGLRWCCVGLLVAPSKTITTAGLRLEVVVGSAEAVEARSAAMIRG